MPILFEPTVKRFTSVRGFSVIRYPIPWPATIGCGKNLQTLELPGIPPGSVLHQTLFKAVGSVVTSGSPITPVTTQARFYINGQAVAANGTTIRSCTIFGCRLDFDLYTNVGAHVAFGRWNDFVAEVVQSWYPLGCVSAIENLSAYIEYEYTGEPPAPPKPKPPEWQGYLKWGLIGVGAIVAVGVVVPKIIDIARKRGK